MTGIDGATLREWRRSRGWDVPALARELRKTAGDDPVPVHDALVRMIRRWEREGLRTERYELLYRALGFDHAADGTGRRDVLKTGPASAGAASRDWMPDEAEQEPVALGVIGTTGAALDPAGADVPPRQGTAALKPRITHDTSAVPRAISVTSGPAASAVDVEPAPVRNLDVLSGEALTERLSYVLRHPAGTDLIAVAYFQEQVHQLDERYVHVPSTTLLAPAGQCLGQVRFLAAHATRSRVRRELFVVEAQAAILMSQLVWDASQRRDHASARMYLDQAIDAARQIRDPAAEGLALLRKSMIALYGERDPREGLALAQQAAQAAGQVSAVLTGLALLHAAEAYAMLGEAASCETALAGGERQMGRMTGMDAAAELYSDTQLGRMAGSCYLSLQNAGRAQVLLEATASSLNDHSKSQAVVLCNLALALIRQGSLDEAAGRLHQAMDIIELNWGGGGLSLAFEAGRELRRWRDVPVVHDVHDRLLTLMAG